jgi:tripartite-type tricarboxylate transporter receptor subunit TctC
MQRRHLLAQLARLGAGTGISAATCIGLPLATLPRAARAQDFPARPLRIVVPFAPGGLTDVIARQAAEELKAELRQPVVVDNRPGASGHIGAEAAARAAPDGYTLALLSTLHAGGAVYQPDIVRYDLMRDFTPLGMLGSSPAMLVARNELRLRHVADMVARARARPGELSLATVAAYIGELLEAAADIELNLILYRGAAAATNDLLGGSVDMMSGTASDMMQLLRSGRFTALGVSGSAVLPYAPQARPIVETLPQYRGGQWYGLYAPSATTAAGVARLRSALAAAVQRPDYRARMGQALVEPPDLSVEGLSAEMRASLDAFTRARARRPGRSLAPMRG